MEIQQSSGVKLHSLSCLFRKSIVWEFVLQHKTLRFAYRNTKSSCKQPSCIESGVKRIHYTRRVYWPITARRVFFPRIISISGINSKTFLYTIIICEIALSRIWAFYAFTPVVKLCVVMWNKTLQITSQPFVRFYIIEFGQLLLQRRKYVFKVSLINSLTHSECNALFPERNYQL